MIMNEEQQIDKYRERVVVQGLVILDPPERAATAIYPSF